MNAQSVDSRVFVPASESPDESEENRAAIYARTSSASQRFGYSIDEQVRQCNRRCDDLGWTVTHIFRDEAVSGKDTERPMFQKMLIHAERGNFDTVVFWKLDRFSRSIMHAVQLEKKFRDWDIALHSVTEQLDTTTATGRFNFRNIANAAEFERDLIKQRTRMGHIARALEHKWPNNSPPLGYELRDDDRLTVKPDEAVLVRRIFREYIQAQSMPTVADLLNEEGLTTRAGNSWRPRTVGTILRNQIYAGEYAVGEVEEAVPEYQILDEGTFQQVTRIRHRFRRSGSSQRGSMPRERKENRVNRVLNQYLEYMGVD